MKRIMPGYLIKFAFAEEFMMDQNLAIGVKVKQLRTGKKLTLKQLSAMTGLSTGFLSQLERGLSTIAIDSLNKVAKSLDVELQSFFQPEASPKSEPIVRSFEQRFTQISPRIMESVLSQEVKRFHYLPRLYQLLPSEKACDPLTEMYSHSGEEMLYVLEGVLTLYFKGVEYSLYPGDCFQLSSEDEHNWTNRTNRIVRFIQINYPNPYLDARPDSKA